jgi:uncharacterized protein (TIGR02466 family)
MTSHLHKNIIGKVIKPAEITNVDVFDIFPTTVFSGNLNVDNDKVLNECYQMKIDDPQGVERSNYNGWQSKLQHLEDNNCWLDYPIISDLAAKGIQFINEMMIELKYDVKFREDACCWWTNVNDKFSYNVLHSHPKSDIVGVYYPKISSSDQGEITFVRTDGSLYNDLYSESGDNCFHKLSVEQGKIYFFPAHLLHYVSPNQTNQERVSISFNFCI